MITFVIASLPVLFLFIFFYWKDKYEKEPPLLMLKAFFGGILSVVLVLLTVFIPKPSFDGAIMASFSSAFIEAAIPEELAKFLFLYLFIWKNKYFNEYYDGILYSVLVALGFAWIENILYVSQGGVSVGLARAVLAVPGHALDGVLMGYFFSLAKFEPENRTTYLGFAILSPIIAHGVYDFILMYISKPGVSSLLVGILFIVFFRFVIALWKLCLRKIEEHLGRHLEMVD